MHWVIPPGKVVGDADFIASATDLATDAAILDHGYRGGPWRCRRRRRRGRRRRRDAGGDVDADTDSDGDADAEADADAGADTDGHDRTASGGCGCRTLPAAVGEGPWLLLLGLAFVLGRRGSEQG